MRRFIKSVANETARIRARPPVDLAARIAQEHADAQFAKIPGIDFLNALKVRLTMLWRQRWIYPHNSFTSKGPGLKHDDGETSHAKLIHKSLTKTAVRGYTQNKREIAARELSELTAAVEADTSRPAPMQFLPTWLNI